MSGFIALHREAFTHPILKDGDRFRAWFWLVANAAWKQTKQDVRGRTIIVERGQICAGRDYLAKEWGWSPSAVERFLRRLETEHMIGREAGQGKSLITICNYEKYQDRPIETGQPTEQQTGQKSDRHRTAKEQGKQGNNISLSSDRDITGVRAQDSDEPKPSPAKPKPVIPDWVPIEPWNGFVAMRAKIKKPLSDRAVAQAINKLTELRRCGHDPGDVLDQSTFHCWQGLFEIKDNRNEPRNSSTRDHRQNGTATGDSFVDACAASFARSQAEGGQGFGDGHPASASTDWP